MSSASSFESPSDIYSTLEEISLELERRKNDKDLAAKVKSFLGEKPHFFENDDAQYAFFSRPIITPNTEIRYFVDIIPLFNLEPLFLEYPSKFVSKNKEKRFLGKLCFSGGLGKKFGHKVEYHRIIEFSRWDGKDMVDVKTTWGEGLCDFHRGLFSEEFPDLKEKVVDFTNWFNVAREQNGFYYLTFLALFIRNGVLFENFLEKDSDELRFFHENVLPSFKKAVELFGVKPLIFPLLPIKDEKNEIWLSFHGSLKEKVKGKNTKTSE